MSSESNSTRLQSPSTSVYTAAKLGLMETSRMYLRNLVRRMIRFPILPITFFFFLVLLLQKRINLSSSLPIPELSQFTNTEPSLDLRILLNPRMERELRLGTTRCPDLRRPLQSDIRTRSEVWQYDESGKKDEIVVYSAFFDDRPILDFTTWIRVLGVASLSSDRVFCYVWYGSYATPYVTTARLNLAGRKSGYGHNNRTYVQYLFSCQLPGVEPVPSHVSLATNECNQSSIYLPVERPVKGTPDQEFGVCVPIAFGSVPVQVFVEWMELMRLFGVTEFNVYDANMTGMTEVFDYYSTRGLLRVSRAPPAIDLFNLDGIKLGSVVSLNDCMMRNLYRYRTIIVVDMDEFIIPRMHRNYTAMLQHIDKSAKLTDRYRGYAFRNAYFFRELMSDASEPWYLRTAVHRTRSELKKNTVMPKSFIDPRVCLSVFNHFCFIPFKVDAKPRFIDVHPSIAVTHHYRLCEFPKARCEEYYNASYRDDTALRFKGEVMPLVKNALRELRVLP